MQIHHSRSIVPTYTGEFDVNIVTPLPIGNYSITSIAAGKMALSLIHKTIPFEIKEPYVAPSEEATVTLTPKSPAVLKTTDGRFTINFPAGAVFSDASVTLRPFQQG